MVVKTFRGLLADGAQDQIRLQTIKGKVGYRIIKFETIAPDPMDASTKSVTQIWKSRQSTIGNAINFSDSDLLAAAYTSHNQTSGAGSYNYVVFDNEIFNQDIFVSTSANPGTGVNYYLVLEVVELSSQAAEYTTLKDIRSRAST